MPPTESRLFPAKLIHMINFLECRMTLIAVKIGMVVSRSRSHLNRAKVSLKKYIKSKNPLVSKKGKQLYTLFLNAQQYPISLRLLGNSTTQAKLNPNYRWHFN